MHLIDDLTPSKPLHVRDVQLDADRSDVSAKLAKGSWICGEFIKRGFWILFERSEKRLRSHVEECQCGSQLSLQFWGCHADGTTSHCLVVYAGREGRHDASIAVAVRNDKGQ